MATNSSDQGEEMRRKASALLRYSEMCSRLTDINFIGGQRVAAMEARCEMLTGMANQVLDVLPVLCEQIEMLSELCAELFTQKTKLQALSRDLAASLRSNPNATNS